MVDWYPAAPSSSYPKQWIHYFMIHLTVAECIQTRNENNEWKESPDLQNKWSSNIFQALPKYGGPSKQPRVLAPLMCFLKKFISAFFLLFFIYFIQVDSSAKISFNICSFVQREYRCIKLSRARVRNIRHLFEWKVVELFFCTRMFVTREKTLINCKYGMNLKRKRRRFLCPFCDRANEKK